MNLYELFILGINIKYILFFCANVPIVFKELSVTILLKLVLFLPCTNQTYG